MQADRRRIVLANIAAALLVSGAMAACGSVSFAGESARATVIPMSLSAVAAALVVAGFAWTERRAKFVVALATLILVAGAGLEAYEYFAPPVFAAADDSELPVGFRKLVPLHTPLTKPKPDEWLNWNVELGQSYSQYVGGDRVRLDDMRRVIYMQPLGDFNDDERKILKLTAEFLGLFYQVPVRVNEDLPLSVVPESGRRLRPDREARLITGYVLREVLKPRLPADAVAMLALTKSGLSPNAESGSLLGQASLVDRVGVWSIGWIDGSFAYGPAGDENEFLRMLRRTLRISTHETGHMFSIDHCIYYRCCMNGSSGLTELDRQPLWLCPHCQAKLAYATGGDPTKQLADLITFADAHGLKPEGAFWRRSLAAMQGR